MDTLILILKRQNLKFPAFILAKIKAFTVKDPVEAFKKLKTRREMVVYFECYENILRNFREESIMEEGRKSLLEYSVEAENFEMFEFLLEKGFDITAYDFSIISAKFENRFLLSIQGVQSCYFEYGANHLNRRIYVQTYKTLPENVLNILKSDFFTFPKVFDFYFKNVNPKLLCFEETLLNGTFEMVIKLLPFQKRIKDETGWLLKNILNCDVKTLSKLVNYGFSLDFSHFWETVKGHKIDLAVFVFNDLKMAENFYIYSVPAKPFKLEEKFKENLIGFLEENFYCELSAILKQW